MNKFRNILLTAALLGMLGAMSTALAEDTDIYARPADDNEASNPNILFIIDNSANWSAANQGWPGGVKQGQSELRALYNLVGILSPNVNVGLMLFTPGSGGTNRDGGYVRFRVRPMNQTNKDALRELIGPAAGCTAGANSLNGTPNCLFQNFDSPAEKVGAAKTDYSAVMFEVFKYFGGYTSPTLSASNTPGSPVNSTHFGRRRYAGDPDAKTDPFAFIDPYGDLNRTIYYPPINGATSCAKSYVIFIGNGFPSQDSPGTLLSEVGGDTTQLPVNVMTPPQTTVVPFNDLLETTSCGTYNSVATCDSAASTLYGPLYAGATTLSISCALANTCTSGAIITTPRADSACGAFTTAANCITSLQTLYPGQTSYSCTPSACTQTITPIPAGENPVYTTPACTADDWVTNCQTFASAIPSLANYGAFTCAKLTGTTGCSGGDKKYEVTASEKYVSSNFYSRSTTLNTTSVTEAHTITATGTRTIVSTVPTGAFQVPTQINYADEWARYLNRTDVSAASGFQNVTTYTIDVFKDHPDGDQTALLMSMARAGGGKYFAATNEAAILNAIQKIVSEIQSVNSVFASSSLPVSVNTQGTYLNQVFMGMFRPDSSAAPRWAGNLKQYRFKIFNGILRLADMNGDEAISSTTGFVTPCAVSFWSSDTGTYWDYSGSKSVGDCFAVTSDYPVAGSPSIYSDYPDGEIVEKGGAAQQLRGTYSSGGTLVTQSNRYAVCGAGQTPLNTSCRLLKTCDGSSATSCTSFTDFIGGNGAITSTMLNTSDRANLINWVRGRDVDNENDNFTTSIPPLPFINEVRPSVHGGVVHAQPAVIDYGGSTGVMAFYGSDDFVFHAIVGNQGANDGKEAWSFIAPEHYGQFNRLRDNGNLTPRVDFPGTTGSVAPKAYGFDGGIGVYQKNTTVWIFPSQRRGGRAIYAFDVSDPFNPSIKWRKGCFSIDDSLCSTGWSDIGQTWSKPNVAYLRGYSNPVLIFGGGYDPCEDANSTNRCGAVPPNPPPSPVKGANVWFVDAATGNIIRTYKTNYSVPGDLTMMKDIDGFVTHVYAADTGGYVYRMNVGTYDGTNMAGNWSVDTTTVNVSAPSSISIASLSGSTNVRKFLSGPAVVPYTGFNAVLVGSGDREHPLVNDYACANYTWGDITQRFYMLIDRPNSYLTQATNSSLVNVTTGTTSFNSATATITNTSPAGTTSSSNRGWYFNFGPCEQSVNKGLVIAGIAYFGTNAPAPTSAACATNLGNARGYAVDFLTGNPVENAPRSIPYTGGGMPPSPVAGVVDVDGLKLPFCIGCVDPAAAAASALQGTEVTINPQGSRFRSYWYIENE